MEFVGGGGTNFKKIFEYIRKQIMEEPNLKKLKKMGLKVGKNFNMTNYVYINTYRRVAIRSISDYTLLRMEDLRPWQ